MSWLLASNERMWMAPQGLVRGLMFWAQPASTAVPVKVRNVLLAQYALDITAVSAWRYSATAGRLSGRQVRYFRIFDPSLTAGKGNACTYGDLDNHSQAVLFDGYVDDSGYVNIARRSSARDDASHVA